MRRWTLGAAFLVVSLSSMAAPAQSISVTNNPVTPGSTASVLLTAPLGGIGLNYLSNPLHVAWKQGELAYPFDQPSDYVLWLNPGASTTLSFPVPATGLGAVPGSWMMYFHNGYGSQAVTRLDLLVPTAAYPWIHSFPTKLHDYFRTHEVTFAAGGAGAGDWSFGNVGPQPHTFAVGEVLQIRSAATGAVLSTLSLAGTTVPPGGVTRIDLPLQGLPAGPHDVLTTWVDPGSGALEQRRHGIRNASRVDLHLPTGKSLPQAGGIPAFVACIDFPYAPSPSGPPLYAVAVGFLPGVTGLAPGLTLPLVPDVLSLGSIQNGLGGLLVANVGVTVPYYWQLLSYGGAATASGIQINHPGISGLAGLTLRVAALAFDPLSGVAGASQPEFITLQ